MALSPSFRLFSTKIPKSLFHPSTPITKTLISSSPITPTNFFRSITIQSVPTAPNSSPPSSSPSIPLQPIEELPIKLQEIVKLFQSVQEPKAKYEQLLFYGQKLKPLDSRFKTSENKVQGCVSQVWVRAYLDSGTRNVVFEADSDSVLTKGLAALLVQGLSGQPVQDVLRVSPDFVVLLGLQQSLTPSRNNGFLNMLKLMQKKALKLYVEAEKGVESGNESVGSGESMNSGVEVDKSGSEVNSNNSNVDDSVEDPSDVLGSRGGRIKEILERELRPVDLEIEDISYQHAGHAGVRGSDGETHFNLRVVSKEFEGKSMVKRHRLIYSLLENELQSGLHALSIEAKTPAEVQS